MTSLDNQHEANRTRTGSQRDCVTQWIDALRVVGNNCLGFGNSNRMGNAA
jgi:hypothetical protein